MPSLKKRAIFDWLPGTVWDVGVDVVRVEDKKTFRLLKVSFMDFWDKTMRKLWQVNKVKPLREYQIDEITYVRMKGVL